MEHLANLRTEVFDIYFTTNSKGWAAVKMDLYSRQPMDKLPITGYRY